jgi:hypothetical protein
MQHKEKWPIRQPIVNVEQEPVQAVLKHGPDYVACEEAQHGLDNRVHRNASQRRKRKVWVDSEGGERPSKLKEGSEE